MKTSINYHENYSDSYREQLINAFTESQKLGFTRTPFISVTESVPDDTLAVVSELANNLSGYLDVMVPGYWGNSCQTLSTNFFAHLNSQGIKAEIVLGNVTINGVDEFETSLDSLQREVRATEPLTGHQAVHAWVSLGDDTIVDAALPPRLVKYYNAPPHFNDMIFIGRASNFSSAYKVRYEPILVGSEFFAKTNPPDPMDLLDKLKKLRRS